MKRIQRKRIAGWRIPVNTISIARPGNWGNPFKTDEYSAGRSVVLFEKCLKTPYEVYYYFYEIQATIEFKRFTWMNENIHLLFNKDLACFCKEGEICHGDPLLKFAEEKRLKKIDQLKAEIMLLNNERSEINGVVNDLSERERQILKQLKDLQP